jgi:hypothetical protein
MMVSKWHATLVLTISDTFAENINTAVKTLSLYYGPDILIVVTPSFMLPNLFYSNLDGITCINIYKYLQICITNFLQNICVTNRLRL